MRFEEKSLGLKDNLRQLVDKTIVDKGRGFRTARRERRDFLAMEHLIPNFQFDTDYEIVGYFWGSWGGIDIYIPWNIGLLDSLAKQLENYGWKLEYQSKREDDELQVKFRFLHPDTEIGFTIHMAADEDNEKAGQSCHVEVIGEEQVITTQKRYKIVCEGEEWEHARLESEA